jgi:hypothetical protein
MSAPKRNKITFLLFFLLSIQIKIFAWVPSDFALLTWNLNYFVGAAISNALPDDFSVVPNNDNYNFTNAITSQVHTVELFIVQLPNDNDLPEAIVFLYLEDSDFGKNFNNSDLDHIEIINNDVIAKIGVVGADENLVQLIKEVLLNLDFSKYEPYEL